MEASFTPFRSRWTTRFIACWLFLCASGWLAGCASTRGKGVTDQASDKNAFTNLFESKKKAREIIDPEAGLDEYDAAVVKYEQKEYDAAAGEFKALAKKYYDYPVEEDALFMLAECRFAQKRYAWAQDAYDGLIKKYPSSRHLEKSTRRLYAIGAMWLNGDDNTDTKELIQVSATDVTKPEAVKRKPPPNSVPLVPNLTDKSRPLFDTPGNALKALKSVWLYDPLGPLADDALMLTAVYHIRKGDLRDADHYLQTLRTDYPKSEHTQNAFVVGSHIKLASYQGARYDGRDLVDADDLIHSTLNLFPNVEDREGLEAEIVKIRELGAERSWSRAEYYRHRAKPAGEAIYCETILKEFPESKFAQRAADRLKELGPKYWTGMLDHYPGENSVDSPRVPETSAPQKSSKLKPPVGRAPGGPKSSSPPNRQARPPAKIKEPLEELPETEPRQTSPEDDTDQRYERLPPARQRVDEPDLVEDVFDGGIEQTSANASSGRAKP